MSGDVQPRKRRDKKRKRDSLDRKSEGEIVFTRKQSLQDDEPREQHQGVHGSKMGSDDVHLHVQGDHETGGHWCAKIFFFSLLAILLGLVGLIILENRGLSDLDTPLSESRFSNYFDGWVDEHRESHDEHDAVSASIEEHEHGDEPFEEEEDHSEVDDEDDHEDEDTNEDDQEEEEAASEEVDAETAEEDEEETQEEENQTAEEEDEEADEEEKTVEETAEETQEEEDEEKDNDEDEEANENEESEEKNDEEEQDETAEEVEPAYSRTQHSAPQSTSAPKEDDDDDDEPFEEEDDDGTFESLESVVDNDAEELLLLQEKARQQQADAKKEEPQPEKEPTAYTSSLAVKFGVGVALALVARLVLIRKNPTTNYSEDDILNANEDGEEEYVEEEVEEEEEIEVTDDEYEQRPKSGYVPETFEELNSMYRPKRVEPPKQEEEKKDSPPKSSPIESFEPKVTKTLGSQQQSEALKPVQLRFGQYHRENTSPKPEEQKKSQATPTTGQTIPESKKTQSYTDEPDDEIEYDDDEDLYDDEMVDEEEEEDVADDEGDEDDLSDVDDSELMNRLEAKYGRLPTRDYESDEDVEDQSWTKIKSRGGGPQSMEDDAFEEELRRANEEMLRERHNSALTLFESLSLKYPDKHEAFLGKARVLDKLSEIRRSNSILIESLNAYKRYLAFGESILDDKLFAEIAQRCIDRMRFIGLNVQAIPIHQMLIERFPDNVNYRNQLAVTYLFENRLSDAKTVLKEVLQRWPANGYALVHYGFVLRNLDQNLELAVKYLRRGIDTQEDGTQDGRFYFHLGDSLLRLGRIPEAREVYRRGAKLNLFPSEYQRSLYNVKTLRAQPFWSKKESSYEMFFNKFEMNWQKIRDEGFSVLNSKGTFQDETENLRAQGDWKQFELFSRGQRRQENCMRTPFTCGLVEAFPSARFCTRGQVKFSVMLPGTHVWPHCGPTNCRLRAHLGLKVPAGTELRVAEERRSWTEGKFLIFDDSFEHEVWHNGTSFRLVLIVDFWHPELTEKQRRTLSPI